MRNVLTTLLVLALVTGPALAHGGQYKGPSDAGSASGNSGGTVAPPTNPGGAAAPGPGAAASGGATSAPTRSGSGRTARGGSNRGAVTSGGDLSEASKGYEIWEFWWENNKDRFLNLKDRLVKQTNVSGSPGMLSGRGTRKTAQSSRRPDAAMINTEVIPALLDLIKTSDDSDILDSAVLALARTGREDMADTIVQAAMPLLGNRELSVQSSATLSLGVLGSGKAGQALQDILRDDSSGRRLTNGSANWLTRAFAALSLGLIADEDSVNALTNIVESLPDSDKDIKVCAIVGLGLIGSDHPNAATVRDFLVKQLGDRKLDPLIKSYIPTSLGKLGDPAAVGPLVDTFKDRDADNLVLQSTAIGLGLLAGMDQPDVVNLLIDYVKEGKDEQTRHYCIIALAQIGARDENFEAHKDLHDEVIDLLGKEIQKKGKSDAHRSWAALAGAIYSRGQEDQQPTFIERIEAAYKKESDPSFKSAFAVALGLLNDQGSAKMIFEDFNSRQEQDFRGYAAVALGFLQYTESADAMRGLVQNKTTTPTLRLQVATGLGLMSDTQAVPVLIETLDKANTLGVSSAVAKALGLIGDRDSIQPLKNIATNDSVQKITRAFACVALGIVGEKTDQPWNAAISANNNYRAQVPSIQEVLDIL
ncbi:MAG: HEAT repeat domain-containing protein [Planctomycetes bacterium]|nr:HEAT repeat domain-containing protein [Planctomycetota bacterium]